MFSDKILGKLCWIYLLEYNKTTVPVQHTHTHINYDCVHFTMDLCYKTDLACILTAADKT